MLLPGSFAGKISSPSPHLGPEPRNLKSLAILIRLHAMTLRSPDISAIVSWAANASNLLGCVTNGRPETSHICQLEI